MFKKHEIKISEIENLITLKFIFLTGFLICSNDFIAKYVGSRDTACWDKL